MLLVVMILLLVGCAKASVELYEAGSTLLSEAVEEYYDELGITADVRQNAEAVYETYIIRDSKEVTVRLPEYWENIYTIQARNGITVYEKFNYDLAGQWGMGQLWSITAKTHDEFKEIAVEYNDAYAEVLFANCVVIGSDNTYVYLLWLPTDVQFVPEVKHAWDYYKAAMANKDKFITDFLEVNEITINEKAPKIN